MTNEQPVCGATGPPRGSDVRLKFRLRVYSCRATGLIVCLTCSPTAGAQVREDSAMQKPEQSPEDTRFDLILVGGGLQNGLIALSALYHEPARRIVLIERDL